MIFYGIIAPICRKVSDLFTQATVAPFSEQNGIVVLSRGNWLSDGSIFFARFYYVNDKS